MTKQTRVTIAGRQYTLSEKNAGPAREWREHLNQSSVMQIFRSMGGAVDELTSIAKSVFAQGANDREIDPTQMMKVVQLGPLLVNALSGSIDEIVDMLFDYAPELAADKEYIFANGFDRELIEAFCEVVKLCFPILALLALVGGSKGQPISSNSPTQNGGTGRKALGQQKKT